MFYKSLALIALGIAAVHAPASASSSTSAYAITGASDNWGGYHEASVSGSRNPNAANVSTASASYAKGGMIGSASASANLATGALKTFASAATTSGLTESRGEASWRDNIRFDVSGGAPARVTVQFRFHGVQKGGLDDLYYASGEFLLGGAGMGATRMKNGGSGSPQSFVSYGNWSTFNATTDGDTQFLEATFVLGGSTSWMNVSASLVTIAQRNALSDFSNTAAVRFILPQTVTMTSFSGVFLSQAVPEPASWAMMIAGFALTGAAARRRVAPSVRYA